MALTKASLVDLNANELILDLDADTSIRANTDDTVDIKIAGNVEVKMTATALAPGASDGNALGTAALEWSDLFLADGAVINFGDDQDVSLTHVADTGLLLSSTDKLMFNDASQFIQGASATVLDIAATDEIELTSTLIDVVGNLAVSGTIVGAGALTAATSITVGSAVLTEAELETLDGITVGTAIASKVVTTDANIDTSGQRNLTITGELDAATGDFSGDVDIDGTANLDVVDIDGATQIDATVTVGVNGTGYDVQFFGDTTGSNLLWDQSADDLILSGAAGLIIPDGGNIGSASDPDAIAIGADGDVTLTQDLELHHDGAIISFGGDGDVTLTHVHNDGLILNTDMQLQFRDSAINIRSDADGDLDINADDEIELNSTLVDINANVEISGTLAQVGVATFTARDIHSGGMTIANDGTIGSVGDADSIAISSAGVVTMTQIPVLSAGLNVSGGTITGTLATAAQTNVTSLGTLTALQIDNININTNTISSTAGTDLLITPVSGQQIVLDGTIVIDAGVVTGATSITSTAFVGGLTGNVTGNVSGTALTVTQAAQSAITSLGTLTALTVDNISINTSTVTASADLIFDAAADIVLDADGGKLKLKDDGTEFGQIFNNSGLHIISKVSDQDIVFKGNDGGSEITALTLDMSDQGDAHFNRHAKLVDDANLVLGGGSDLLIFHDHTNQQNKIISESLPVILAGTSVSLNNGANNENMLVANQNGQVNLYYNNVLKFETSSAGGTLTGDLTVTDDIILNSDSAAITFGADADVTLTHVADKGLTIKTTGTGDGVFPILNLSAGQTDMQGSDPLGRIDFQAPDEGTGTDAILVAGRIQVVSEGDFSASNNATSMQLAVGASGTAGTVMTLTSTGRVVSQATAKTWIDFNGQSTVSIRDSHNVSGLGDEGTGYYTVSHDVDLATVNAAAVSSASGSANTYNDGVSTAHQAVGSFTVMGWHGTNGTATDHERFYVVVFGD